MAGLVVDLVFKGTPLRSIPFDRAALRIGRLAENEIQIDNAAVSRLHARLLLVEGRVFLEDQGSENGCYLNDVRVRGRAEIGPGDRIAIGKHELRVRSAFDTTGGAAAGAPHAADAWTAQPTYVAGPETRARMRGGAPPPAPPRTPDQETTDMRPDDIRQAPEPAPAPLHAGLIVQRDGRLERIVAWEADVLTAGRAAECDLVLAQDEISRRHARFVRADGRYEVHDLGSVNGTLVNGARRARHVLEVGDVVAIEGFQLTFVLDREPIAGAVRTAPPAVASPPPPAAPRDTFAMTLLQEELPGIAEVELAPEPLAPAEPFVADDADLFAEVEPAALEDPASIEERKALAAARPRGSSRASSVQELADVSASPRFVTLELRLRVDELPAPLREALEAGGASGLALPGEMRLRLTE